jgi:hypothetical protein
LENQLSLNNFCDQQQNTTAIPYYHHLNNNFPIEEYFFAMNTPSSINHLENPLKSANSAVNGNDYVNLFRGLSSYVPSISISGEKTYTDLTDAILNDQARATTLSNSSSNSSNEPPSQIKPDASTMLSILTPVQLLLQRQESSIKTEEIMILDTENVKLSYNRFPENDHDSRSSTNSNSSSTSSAISFGDGSASNATNQPITTRTQPQKLKPVKRLSNTSTTSSVEIPRVVGPAVAAVTAIAIVAPTRGRKPNGSSATPTTATVPPKTNAKKTKKQLMLEDAEKNKKPVVCFGNKVVPKETDEYYKRRENNNEAVKKCREKLTQKQKEREDRMRILDDENKKLTGTVDALNKELNVLKNIIIQMNPQQKLPDYITNLFKELDDES